MKYIIYISLICLLPIIGYSQNNNTVSGKVTELNKGNEPVSLLGVNVYWSRTTKGVVTDENGLFTIDRIKETSKLVFSFIGYANDTIETANKQIVNVTLKSSVTLDAVDIVQRKKSTEYSFANPLKVQYVGEKELQKAACCNLSESFETNPSVDVSFTDAVSGTRQIQMLGLAGPYTQITREVIPNVRGLSSLYGLMYIPGTWIESMQLNKGAGSVVNGFESIAGQINFEIRKPEEADKLYLNMFANAEGRLEGNANYAHKFNDNKWSTAVLLHASDKSIKHDKNNDGFLDSQISSQYIALNRWKYVGDDGTRLQFGVKGIYIDNIGGQKEFDPDKDALGSNLWGANVNTKRIETWSKIGKVFEDMPWKSIGLQLSGSSHDQESYFGTKKYDAKQHALYANLMFQSILSNTKHKFATGASFQLDDYQETLDSVNFDRTESVPGAYFEYTYEHSDKFTAVAGIRADYHNTYNAFVTPRLHLRYELTKSLVLRASAGSGRKTANIIAENVGLLSSSRAIIVNGLDKHGINGLSQEVAWNYGVNVLQCFEINGSEGTIGLDFYRTDFQNQIVVDLDQDPGKAYFYNLDGESYSNSFQAQVDYELVKRLDLRLAYRWFAVKTEYQSGLKQKPLIAKQRAFANVGYETPNAWKFDYTVNWQGSKRIPYTGSNPVEYQLLTQSPDYVTMNTQVTKSWDEVFDVYVGVENLLNYKQDDPILAASDPFGPYFDSSLVWGPIFGRNAYIGLRYIIQ